MSVITIFPPNRSSRGRSRYPYWCTSDGAKMRIEDMTQTHIGHTLAMLERAALACYEDSRLWPEMDDQMGLCSPGEPEDWMPRAYDDMVAELVRRGLPVPESRL